MRQDDAGDTIVVGSHEAQLEIGRPEHVADGVDTRIPLRISGRGIEINTVIEIAPWSGGRKRLTDYFDDLSAAWRGWSGTKDWNDDGPNIRLSATHDGLGTVRLDVAAERFGAWDGAGSWTAAVRVPIEAGSLERIARQVSDLLEASGDAS